MRPCASTGSYRNTVLDDGFPDARGGAVEAAGELDEPRARGVSGRNRNAVFNAERGLRIQRVLAKLDASRLQRAPDGIVA